MIPINYVQLVCIILTLYIIGILFSFIITLHKYNLLKLSAIKIVDGEKENENTNKNE